MKNPDELASLFQRDRTTHVYGLADLEEPYWSSSRWFRDGDAVVGIVSVGHDWVTVYAMSQEAPESTLRLLEQLLGQVPARTSITGPTGLFETITARRRSRHMGPHWRMILDTPPSIDVAHDVVRLTEADLQALTDLHESDPGRSFFLPSMLQGNPFVGIWEAGELVASAGTHVVSARYGVAALGAVITRPSHRGRGLGTRATAALVASLWDEYETIGLNVETANAPALRVYTQIGFRPAFQYEEVEAL